jgi:4-amino-4-deoxy-L-arabinose transferase-like glycosyltransferase
VTTLRRLATRIPPEAVAVGMGLFVLLAALVTADPDSRVTASIAPFTDEAGNFVNARNFVQLGTWSTDEWNLHLVNLPFSLLEAASFRLFGVGIVQARLPAIGCVSLTAAALVWGLRGVLGRAGAIFAGLAFGTCGLVLFYGRLAFLEDLVVLGLTLGALPLLTARPGWRAGLVSGLWWSIAVGTKPSALFAVIGIAAAVLLLCGRRDGGIRRWAAGAMATIAAAGALWVAAIYLPNRAAVATDLTIWPPYQWRLAPAELIQSVVDYGIGHNDHLYGPMLLPLIALAVAGTGAILALRGRLNGMQTRLAAIAFGWAIAGFGILMLVSYRPNRYVVPLVPALAMLAAIGLTLTLGRLRERSSRGSSEPARRFRSAPAALLLGAAVVACTPGLAWYGAWAGGAEHRLVSLQSQFDGVAPSEGTVAGPADVVLFLMDTRLTTVMYGLANNDDLYGRGVRWFIVRGDPIAPPGVPESVWAARQARVCGTWRETTVCLYVVP